MASYTLFIDEINGTLEPYHIKRGVKLLYMVQEYLVKKYIQEFKRQTFAKLCFG